VHEYFLAPGQATFSHEKYFFAVAAPAPPWSEEENLIAIAANPVFDACTPYCLTGKLGSP